MDNALSDKILFSVTEEELQQEAERLIGRKLTEDELRIAGKCVGCGLSSCVFITFKVAIDEAVFQSC